MDYVARVRQCRQFMAEQKIERLALSPGDDMRYLLGYTPSADERACLLLLSEEGATFVVPAVNAK
jgi:Xaa-Pro aminopeptidase